MSNGEPNPIQVIYRDVFGTGKSSALTSKNNEVILKLVKMHILEMEDVLFHLNSAVMMPENPQGESSNQGGGAEEEQIKVSGIKALALVFKQFEFDPEVKMVVSGHTDTSGTAEFNFKLSKERALNILYLIYKEEEEDSRKKWAEVCYNRQKVEDYQQILTYFEKKLSCGCDPQGIDDTWGDDTKKATENFLIKMGLGNVKVKTAIYEIESDQKKRWPVSIWELVYDLYSKELCEVLEISDAELESRRKTSVKFVDDEKKIVACGESFPIDQKEKSNYRSQKNRRVELLFFDKDESPDLTCPADIKNTHKEEDCPLWRKFYFVPLYIDPDDLKAVAYHLQFVYYDKIKQKQLPVPAGLSIKAYEDGHNEIPSETVFKEGVYFVKVKFKNKIKDPARTQFYFELETTNKWVFTKDDKTDPEIVTKTPDEIKKLNFIERHNYYDLPVNWSSRNYWTHYGGDIKKAKKYEEVVKELKLKPLGDEILKREKPLIFSLDDIVIVEANGNQNITDRNGFADATHPKGQPKPLSDKSRVRILHVDLKDNKLKILEPDSSGTVTDKYKSSLIRFQKDDAGKYFNLISIVDYSPRVVVFCGEFYDVTSKRTIHTSTFDYSKNNILGARSAVINDTDCHYSEIIRHNSNVKTVQSAGIGDFEVHYFHGGGLSKDNLYSYQLIYWSSFITKDTNPTVGGVGDFRPATPDEVDEFKSIGMINAMNHWNIKEYQYEDNDKKSKNIVRPFFFFEAFEEFNYVPAAAFNFKASNYGALFTKPGFIQALKDSRGGIPKSVSFICEEKKGSWFLSWRGGANIFSLGSFRIKTRKDDVNRFDGFPFSEFGDPGQYGCLVLAHELGHATGQNDDYTEDVSSTLTNADVPTLGQFGRTENGSRISADDSNFPDRVEGSEAYEIYHDRLTLMVKNGPVRMRFFWRFTHWLNSNGLAGKPLNKFLAGTQFKIYYPRAKYSYFRKTVDKVDPWKYCISDVINAGAGRPWNVYLFKILDETRKNGTKEFKAILTVRLFLAIAYRNNGANHWGDADKATWANGINNLFLTDAVFRKFYLKGGGGDFDPTIIRFIPGFNFYNIGSSPSNAGFNYQIEVKKNSSDAITQSGNVIKCGDGTDKKHLLNYFFAKPLNSVGIKKEDLKFINDWFCTSTVGNGTFTIDTL